MPTLRRNQRETKKFIIKPTCRYNTTIQVSCILRGVHHDLVFRDERDS